MELKFCPECKRPFKKIRSNEQNSYMHGLVFQMIAEELGEYDIDHVKDLMKYKFLKIVNRIKTKGGKEVEEIKIRHTSELSTVEMEEFLKQCRFWARDFLNLDIPEPNQQPLSA